MEFDLIMRRKEKTCKQRKLSNIRVKNFLNKEYTKQRNRGEIQSYKILGVQIKHGIQSVGVQVAPKVFARDINVTVGFAHE